MNMNSDRLADRMEAVSRELSSETTLHIARSCFSCILFEEYDYAKQKGVSPEVFGSVANDILDDIGLPIFDYTDERNALPGKRQPSIRESINATVDRFSVIDELEEVFSDSAASIVYGGSMKYGPFMNVRSGADASDIDMIVLTESERLDELGWRGLMETALIDDRDKMTFFARLGLQRVLFEQDKIDIMSQRFTIANKGYTISSHVMPLDYLDTAYPQDAEEIDSDKDYHMYVRDYKERPFERTHVSNFDMSRRPHNIPVYSRAVDGGFIAYNPAFSIIEESYVPGMYQNLVLPEARYAFDGDGVATARFKKFSEVIAVQEAIERVFDESASVLNTEPRKPILPADVSDILRA